MGEDMKHNGVDFQANWNAISVTKDTDGTFILNGKDTLTSAPKSLKGFDYVLYATGRDYTHVPEGLNLAAAGVDTDKRGKVNSDEWERTNVHGSDWGIYSLGA